MELLTQQRSQVKQDPQSSVVRMQTDNVLLMKAIDDSDSKAQAYLYIKYSPVLHRYLQRFALEDGESENLTQDVFLNICQGKCRYTGGTDAKNYLFGVATKLALNHLRASKRHHQLHQNYGKIMMYRRPSIAGDPTQILEEEEALRILLSGFVALPDKTREAVALVFRHQLRPYEAAKMASCPPAVFRNRLRHGLHRLRANAHRTVSPSML